MDWVLLTLMLPIVACVCVAGILAYNKIEGWGWFLIVAILLASGLKVH